MLFCTDFFTIFDQILPNLTKILGFEGVIGKEKSLLKPRNYLIFNRLFDLLPNLDLNQGPSD